MAKGISRRARTGQSPEFARLRGEIGRYGNVRTGVAAFKQSADVSRFRRILPEALRGPLFRTIVWPNEHPKSYQDMWRPGIPALTQFDAELEWAVQSLKVQSARINSFLLEKDYCERLYLGSKIPELIERLNKIERLFGQSLWLVETRINAIQLASGFDAQRDFASSLLRDHSMPDIARYIVSWLSFRSEENVSALEFARIVADSLPDGAQANGFIRIALGIERSQNCIQAAKSIAHIDGLPPIDRYLFLLSIVQSVIASGDVSAISSVQYSMNALCDVIHDRPLSRLVGSLGADIGIESTMLPMLDAYVEGRFEAAASEALTLLETAASIDALIVLARCAAHQGLAPQNLSQYGQLVSKIYSDLFEVTLAGPDSSHADARLSKLVTTNPSSSWSWSLNLFLQRQRNDDRLHGPNPDQVYSALRAAEDNPSLAFAMPAALAQVYLKRFRLAKTSNSIIEANSILDKTVDELALTANSYRTCRIGALRALRNGNQKRAIHILKNELIDGRAPLVELETQCLLAEAYLAQGELVDASAVCVRLILQTSYLARRLPLLRLVGALGAWDAQSDRNNRVLGELPIVILLNLYGEHVSNDCEELASDAFLDFLERQNVEKPSDLKSNLGGNYTEAKYFYKQVCIPDALDQCFALRSTREVEDERVQIIVRCDELYTETQQSTPVELQDELQQIRTRQIIRDTSFRLDQSKIFVDLDGIQTALGSNMRENWNRYRLLGLQSEAGEIPEFVRNIEDVIGRKLSIVSASVPITERNKLFARMFREVREQFASSKLFGLDANLSTNVRHGYILRELRGPFVAAALVTNLISSEQGYRPNRYWIDKISDHGSDDDCRPVCKALDDFSLEIDAEIERLTRKRIRINSESNPDGLFLFTIGDIELQLLQQRVDSLENYEDFLKATFEYLWAVAQVGLNRVKQCLRSETLVKLNAALDTLQQRVDILLGAQHPSGLTQTISLVRPEVEAAVERVSSWFVLSSSQEYQDYPLQIAFDVGLATVTSYFSHLDIGASIEGAGDVMMAGWTLPSFARLFLLLMENAALHSGMAEGTLTIRATASIRQGLLEISITNKLSSSINLDKLGATVDKLNADFGGEAAQDSVGTERGSGYPKLWKILKHDLRCDHVIEVKLTRDRLFQVEIALNRDGIAL